MAAFPSAVAKVGDDGGVGDLVLLCVGHARVGRVDHVDVDFGRDHAGVVQVVDVSEVLLAEDVVLMSVRVLGKLKGGRDGLGAGGGDHVVE